MFTEGTKKGEKGKEEVKKRKQKGKEEVEKGGTFFFYNLNGILPQYFLLCYRRKEQDMTVIKHNRYIVHIRNRDQPVNFYL